jgi:methyl-accepting chemotaxis protein
VKGDFMKLFTDVKIGRRLGIGFGIVIGLMGVMALLGVVYLESIRGNIEYLKRVNTRKLETASDARGAVGDISFLIGRVVASPDASAREEAKNKIGKIRENYKNAFEELEKLEENREGKDLIARLKSVFAKGKDQNSRVVGLAMSGKSEEAAREYEQLLGIITAALDAADKLVDYEKVISRAGTKRRKGRHQAPAWSW